MRRSAGSIGIHPRVLRHVLFQDVVLDRAAQFARVDALLLGRRDVEAIQDDRGPVDRHGRRDLIERDPVEERLHVGETRDRHAALAYLAFGARMVGVVSHQRREIERDREARLPVLEEELVACVRVAGAAEAGELPHRPQFAAIAGRVDAARERIGARNAERRHVARVLIGRAEERLHRPRGIREREIAQFALRVSGAPLGELGAEARDLGVGVGSRVQRLADRRHVELLGVLPPASRVALSASSAWAAAKGVSTPASSGSSCASSHSFTAPSSHRRARN